PQRPIPPGGPTSNIFGPAVTAPAQSPSRSHPNKPKVGCNITFLSLFDFKTRTPPTAATAATLSAPSGPEPTPSSFPDDTSLKNHEPHLGPKPRSHNRGGGSSITPTL
uniref:Jupiter microtubule associated homolog 2 n=1 Tax=Oreochromis aureus TaxID=47969 RepID=A0AAZ1XIX0_OREAU